MKCSVCGKELKEDDCFCSKCGTPVPEQFESETDDLDHVDHNRQLSKGYHDQVENSLGRFDGKYMLICAILIAVLAVAAGIYKWNYNRQNPDSGTETAQSEVCCETWQLF